MLLNNPWFPIESGLGVRTLNGIAGSIEMSSVPRHLAELFCLDWAKGTREECSLGVTPAVQRASGTLTDGLS